MFFQKRTKKSNLNWHRTFVYIAKNINREITLEDLCSINNLSRVALIREFKKQFGCTPINFVWATRAVLGAYLINLYNSSNIGEIAEFLSFKSQEHFSRRLKSVLGQNPKFFKHPSALTTIEASAFAKLIQPFVQNLEKDTNLSFYARSQSEELLSSMLFELVNVTANRFKKLKVKTYQENRNNVRNIKSRFYSAQNSFSQSTDIETLITAEPVSIVSL